MVRVVEALLFLAPDPLSPQELADAAAAEELGVIAALAELAEQYAPGRSGIQLRELGGGFTFASDPETEDAARRLFSRPRASRPHARPGGDAGDRRLPAAGVTPGDHPHPWRQRRSAAVDAA